MTTAHSAVVIGDGDEVIDGWTVIRVDDVRGHVEVLRWKLDKRVQLVAPVSGEISMIFATYCTS